MAVSSAVNMEAVRGSFLHIVRDEWQAADATPVFVFDLSVYN